MSTEMWSIKPNARTGCVVPCHPTACGWPPTFRLTLTLNPPQPWLAADVLASLALSMFTQDCGGATIGNLLFLLRFVDAFCVGKCWFVCWVFHFLCVCSFLSRKDCFNCTGSQCVVMDASERELIACWWRNCCLLSLVRYTMLVRRI